MRKLNRLKNALTKRDACWKGYTQLGMKIKNGKQVPNCVPEKGVPKQVKQVKESQEPHGYYVPYYDDSGNKRMGKFFKKKEEAEKHLNDNPSKTDSYYPVNDKYQRVSESSDYFRRRQKEEDIISGKKPARKRIPKSNDYFQRRKKQSEYVSEKFEDVHNKVITIDELGKRLNKTQMKSLMKHPWHSTFAAYPGKPTAYRISKHPRLDDDFSVEAGHGQPRNKETFGDEKEVRHMVAFHFNKNRLHNADLYRNLGDQRHPETGKKVWMWHKSYNSDD